MTQQENLNAFINRRMAELGLGYRDLTNAGIGAQTMVNIRNGKVSGLQTVTKEKLAKVLRCSQGDIQAAIANTDEVTPFGEVVIKEKKGPSVMETVETLAEKLREENLISEDNLQRADEAVQEDEPETPAAGNDALDQLDKMLQEALAEGTPACDPEPAVKPKTKKIVHRDIAYPKRVKILKEAIEAPMKPDMTLESFKQRLKNICLEQLAEADPFDTGSVALFSIMGQKLLKELLKE